MISVIVPLYFNQLELYPIIDRCLSSIPAGVEVVIVDDGSPLDTSDFMSYATRWARKANGGYTSAVNLGLALAEGDILVIANDDIVLTNEIMAHFEDSGDGIYSPRTNEEGPGDKFGALWGMNRATYEKMGPLDERMKHFFSDTEYYDRAKKLGVPVTKWEDLIIEHVGCATYNTVDKEAMYKEDQAVYNANL